MTADLPSEVVSTTYRLDAGGAPSWSTPPWSPPQGDGLGLPAALAASDTPGRVRALALIQATGEVLAVHAGRLRDELAGDLTPFSQRTSWGTVLVTDPDPRPVVADRESFAAWWQANYPSECGVTEAVHVADQPSAVAGLTVLASWVDVWLTDPAATPDLTALVGLVTALELRRTVLLPEKAEKGLAVSRDGRVVDGDGLLPAGVEAVTSSRQLRVTLDKGAVGVLAAELTARLAGTPTLGDGDGGVDREGTDVVT